MIERCAEYKKIGDKLLKKLDCFADIREAGVRIAYLRSDEEKKKAYKIVFADCAKVNSRYEWCCHYDFMITVYEPNCVDFDDEQMEILMEHELRHCGINLHGNEPTFYVVPHDIEEFEEIINQYGINWQKRKDNAKRRESKQQSKLNKAEPRSNSDRTTKESIQGRKGIRRGKEIVCDIDTDIEREMHS